MVTRAHKNLELRDNGGKLGEFVVDRANSRIGMFVGGTEIVRYSSSGMSPIAGVVPGGGFTASPRCNHTGGTPAIATTSGTNLDIVVTELYVCEVFIECLKTITGVAIFNGTAVAGNVKVMLFDSSGTRVAISATTAASGTTAFQRVPFSATYAAKGPATFFVGVMGDNSGGDIRTHVVGNFGAGKITGLVYATESGYASITLPTTFTTGLGPLATLY